MEGSKGNFTPIELLRLMVAACAWIGRSPTLWGREGLGTYEQAVAELRREFNSIAPGDEPSETSPTTEVWDRVRREVRQQFLSREPGSFLAWTPLVLTMTFGLGPMVRQELLALRSSARWETQWRDAVRENRAGLPMPSLFYPVSSGTLIHHAYHLHRFETATGRSVLDCSEIVEFGGGYGSMARLAARLGFRGHYHIHDLPEFSAIQRFFIRSVRAELGEGEVDDALARITYSNRREDASCIDGSKSDAIFLATWSFSEVPLKLREEWRSTLARFRFFLFGFRNRFGSIDNRAWFENFATSRKDVEWHCETIEHRGKSDRYLFGVPIPAPRGQRAV